MSKNESHFLRAELHNHSKEDPYDGRGKYKVQYSARELIQHAAKQHTSVLSLTLHGKVYFPKDLQDYAKSKNVLLIPGAELWPSGPHTLAWGINDEERKRTKTLEDLKSIKDHAVICAAHPYHYFHSIGNKFHEHASSFHAVEYTHFYTHRMNMMNKKSEQLAKRYHKSIVGTSDTHYIQAMGYTHASLDAQNTKEDVLEALRTPSRVRLVTKALPMKLASQIAMWHMMDSVRFPKRANL